MKYLATFFILSFSFIFPQSESELLTELFTYSDDVTSIANDLVSMSVDVVWLASQTAGKEVTTGTLTQVSANEWTYAETPTDKLVSTFMNGLSIEYVFTKFNGYKSGGADDFKNSHDIDFTIYVPNFSNVRIQSTATPNAQTTNYMHIITGTMIYSGVTHTLDITHTFDKYYDIGSYISIGQFNDYVIGTATTPTKSFILADQYYTEITHNSDEGRFARAKNRWTNSSVTVGNTTYGFNGVRINWYGGTHFADSANAGVYNIVIDGYQWEVMGTVVKNNQTYGSVEFSTTPVSGTYGPYLVAKLNGGKEVVLDNLLLPFVTDVKKEKDFVPNKFELYQNYPNPFNPTTVISYSIPQSGVVTLKVFDTLGREIATLINKEQKSGKYNISWEANNFPSGIYFYNIRVGSFSETKKMILQK